MVEPAAAPGEHEDPLRAHRERRVERELEVGRVLLGRMALDPRRRDASAAATASGDAESKSPTAMVTSSPSASACSSPLSAAMTGAPERDGERAPRTGGSPPDTTTTTSSDTPSSAGITQIRFCGSAAL